MKEMKDRNSRYTRTKRLQRRNEGRPGWSGPNEEMASALDEIRIHVPEYVGMDTRFGFSRYKGPHGSWSWTDNSSSSNSGSATSFVPYYDRDGHAYLTQVVIHDPSYGFAPLERVVVQGGSSSSTKKKNSSSTKNKKLSGTKKKGTK